MRRRLYTFACLKSNYLLGCYGAQATIFLWNSKCSHNLKMFHAVGKVISTYRNFKKEKKKKTDLKASCKTLHPRNFSKLYFLCQRGVTCFWGYSFSYDIKLVLSYYPVIACCSFIWIQVVQPKDFINLEVKKVWRGTN